MHYQFKRLPEDFKVYEDINVKFNQNHDGKFFYVYFEKKELNTMDVVFYLMKKTGLPRAKFGIAGLKDRVGITRQWISISKSSLKKIGGVDQYLKYLSEIVKILDMKRADRPLVIGMNLGNYFEIYLRRFGKVDELYRKRILSRANKIAEQGCKNFFGMQRFGKGKRNYKRARDFLESAKITTEYQLKFNLQAYVSMWFNEYIYQRFERFGEKYQKGEIFLNGYNPTTAKTGFRNGKSITVFDYKKLMREFQNKDFFYPPISGKKVEADISRVPSGPLIGWNLLMPREEFDIGKFEREFISQIPNFHRVFQKLSFYKIYGLRRPILVFPKNFSLIFDEVDNIKIKFWLPTGSYATILLRGIFHGIDDATCRQNRFIAPRVNE